MKVDVIIPNYNTSALLKKNLPKVVEVLSAYNDITLTIVDDASEKDDLIELKSIIEDKKKAAKLPITLYVKEKNEGFASTVNKGVSLSNAEIIVLLNSDVIPEKNFLDSVLQHFTAKKVFGVGFMDKSQEKDRVVLRGRGIGRWNRGMLIHSKGNTEKNNTLWLSGGSSAIRRDLFNELGGFDVLFNPFYWEDIDLSYRALKRGYHLIFENKSMVTHNHEEGAIKKHFTPQKVKEIAYRNQFLFTWKNITDSDLMLSHILFITCYLFKGIVDRALLKGFFLALIHLPAIIQFRNKEHNKISKSDKNILTEFVT